MRLRPTTAPTACASLRCATSTPPAPTRAGDRGDAPTRKPPDPCGNAGRNRARPALDLFGVDYPTPDGTCIRDYIHVNDLADAHVSALARLAAGGDSLAVNLGTGRGYSVKEVLNKIEEVSGLKVPVRVAPRRPGDPPALVADSTLAERLLHWKATRSLDEIVATAWKWMQRQGAEKTSSK
jgi:UDP-glucose 4-epimerase